MNTPSNPEQNYDLKHDPLKPLLRITPERDLVFYRDDGTESYRCSFDTLVEAIRFVVG